MDMNFRWPFNSGFAFIFLATFCALGSGLAQSCASPPSDSSFLAMNAGANGLGFAGTPTYNGSVPSGGVVYGITRVVGPGTPAEFNGDGTLANYDSYVSNGILSATASVEVYQILLIDSPPLASFAPGAYSLTIYVNGYRDSITGIVWSSISSQDPCGALPPYMFKTKLTISTRYLKFPQRAANGASPMPALNTIAFALSPDNYGGLAVGIDVGALSFKAMAPVVLIHGWNSGPWYWGPSPSTASACGLDRNYSTLNALLNYGYNGGFNFIQPFMDGHYPVDCSVQIGKTLDIGPGGLEAKTSVSDVLQSFGAQHVHLVAHSKGGLWARSMIKQVAETVDADGNNPFAVYSFTTLSTPSLGSPFADLIAVSHEHPLLIFRQWKLLQGLLRGARGAGDMKVGAPALAALGPPPRNFFVSGSQNTPTYLALGADADQNNNGKIDGANQPGNEGYPGLYSPFPALNTVIANQRYQFLKKVQSIQFNTNNILGRAAPVSFIPNQTPQFNDLTVTVPSALGAPGFSTSSNISGHCSSLPCYGANHSTLGSQSVSFLDVLANIKAGQPIPSAN